MTSIVLLSLLLYIKFLPSKTNRESNERRKCSAQEKERDVNGGVIMDIDR